VIPGVPRAEAGMPPRAHTVTVTAMAITIGSPSIDLPAPLEFLLAPPLTAISQSSVCTHVNKYVLFTWFYQNIF